MGLARSDLWLRGLARRIAGQAEVHHVVRHLSGTELAAHSDRSERLGTSGRQHVHHLYVARSRRGLAALIAHIDDVARICARAISSATGKAECANTCMRAAEIESSRRFTTSFPCALGAEALSLLLGRER